MTDEIIKQLANENKSVLNRFVNNNPTSFDIYKQAKYLNSKKYIRFFHSLFCKNGSLVEKEFNILPNCKEEWIFFDGNYSGPNKITTLTKKNYNDIFCNTYEITPLRYLTSFFSKWLLYLIKIYLSDNNNKNRLFFLAYYDDQSQQNLKQDMENYFNASLLSRGLVCKLIKKDEMYWCEYNTKLVNLYNNTHRFSHNHIPVFNFIVNEQEKTNVWVLMLPIYFKIEVDKKN